MKRAWVLAVVFMAIFGVAQAARAESAHRLGGGANYWVMLDDVDAGNIDDDGFSWLLTYQYEVAALLKLEADLEMFQSGFQGIDTTVYAPEAFLVLGSTIYGAAGIGILNADGEFADDPFYVLRAGLDLEILPQVFLDLNVNYRFATWRNPGNIVEDIDADTLTLGAALRFAL